MKPPNLFPKNLLLSNICLLSIINMMYSCNDGQGETKITEIYSCFRDGNNIQIVRQEKGSIRNQIYPIVTDLKYDKQFLLVEQNPDSLWYHVDLSFSLDRSYSRNEQRKTI